MKATVEIPSDLADVNKINNFFVNQTVAGTTPNMNDHLTLDQNLPDTTFSFHCVAGTTPNMNDHLTLDQNLPDTTFSFHCVEQHTISDVLFSIKPSSTGAIKPSSTGADGISVQMLRLCCPVILPYLTHLINICLERRSFPSPWKHALICSLPKTG
ncbi:hypothetical protein QE152_g24633 [Popillia japonica]|uniref:Uncharacterized protein n=1 Tax=Popillia japonica TaxID=7064 RepID=A0AAW1K4U6_POPJA